MSTIALTLDAPGPGAFDEIVFYGPDGRVTLTEPSFTREEAFRDAVSRLVVNAESGRFHDPLGVHFGREVVALLARAAESIAALKHGLSERGQP